MTPTRSGRIAIPVLVAFLALQAACGEASSPGVYAVEGESRPLPCGRYSTYRCREDHSDRCLLNEGFRLAVDQGCHEGRDLLNCTDRDACVEGEWIAESSYGDLLLVRGCVNDSPPGSSMISNPSESLLAAAGLSCYDAWLEIDEMCRALSAQECEGVPGCWVQVEEVIDPDFYCDTGETRVFCEGISQLRTCASSEPRRPHNR
jgi:hypothetical protein